ncbi:MAG TPA: VOC family protein [Anaeromyxobacter sp.]|nr:VOC family protein [Anaeromyxobacter sp.]
MPRLFVNIDVDDVEEAIRFYTGALGLQVGRRLEGGYTELVGAGVPIFLLPAARGSMPFPGATRSRDYVRHWTPVHLDVVVADIEAALARARAAGARVELPVAQHPYGKLALLSDPFGHGFCLLQLEGRGYGEIEEG